MGDRYSLIKPYTVIVDAKGCAVVDVTHSLHGIAWEVVQVGMSLGIDAPAPEVAALVNGIPLVSGTVMANSAFSTTGAAPVSMTTCFYGPPYVLLEAGDHLTVGVIGATTGDIFTVGAYVNEVASPAVTASNTNTKMGGPVFGYVPRAGTRRWSLCRGSTTSITRSQFPRLPWLRRRGS